MHHFTHFPCQIACVSRKNNSKYGDMRTLKHELKNLSLLVRIREDYKKSSSVILQTTRHFCISLATFEGSWIMDGASSLHVCNLIYKEIHPNSICTMKFFHFDATKQQKEEGVRERSI